jgi:hypothetical protein
MYRHWTGNFFKNSKLNNEPFIISKKNWKEIGNIMELNTKQIPSEFGRPLRNIYKHFNGYKATEWSNWTTIYSLSFLKHKLPQMYDLSIIFILFLFLYF